MSQLISIQTSQDIPADYRATPIGRLLEYHNCRRPFESYTEAQLLIGMCMDNRKHLTMPDNFAFIIRAGGANLRNSEFKVSYAIAVGGVSAIALIGHNQCGMENLVARREMFIRGLVERGGWTEAQATEHFTTFAPTFEVGDAAAFIMSETHRLRARYPKVRVAPLMYNVEDNRLSVLAES